MFGFSAGLLYLCSVKRVPGAAGRAADSNESGCTGLPGGTLSREMTSIQKTNLILALCSAALAALCVLSIMKQ